MLIRYRQQLPVFSDNKPIVATTIFPLTDIARNIGGEYVNVVQLIPPGASPHSYALSPQMLSQASRAKALFVIGHNLDSALADKVASAYQIPIVTVDKNIDLHPFEPNTISSETDEEHEEGSIDPHYWLTIPNAEKIAETITQTLSAHDPAHASYYENNLQVYKQELAQTEAELQSKAQSMPQKNFVAMHDGWSYFADHYGLHLVATYEPIPGRQPSISDLNKLRSVIQQYNIATFFTEPQMRNSSGVQLMENEFGVTIGVLDPIGGATSDDSYIAIMHRNMDALASVPLSR